MKLAKHQNICPGCFKDKGEATVCPLCGFDESTRGNPIALPYWTLLNRQYLTGRVLGKLGGFGITYLAWDTRLDIRTAVKEYLPRDFAGREGAGTSVSPHSPEDEKMFRYGLKMFLDEAKTLAKFDHPNIVRVRNVFENNGTAYLVMDYLEGESLHEYLQRKAERMDEARALEILLPVLDGLEEVHKAGFLHRDIKPHNLYLTVSGRTILLDFGAARQAIGESGRSQSVMLTPGYAPFEQYHRRGNQGPWTDIYACAAVFYHMVTGTAPPESTERIEADILPNPKLFNPYLSQGFAQALIQGMALQTKDRPQSVAEFRDLLTPPKPTPASRVAAFMKTAPQAAPKQLSAAPTPQAPPPPQDAPSPPLTARTWKAAAGLAVIMALAAAYPLLQHFRGKPALEQAASSPFADEPNPEPMLTTASPPALEKENTETITTMPTHLTQPKSRHTCPACPPMVQVPGGEFWMGADEGDSNAPADEKPRHRVRVEGFSLGKYEVTQGQWKQVMGSNPSLFPLCGDDCPVENISWNEIQAFIEKLKQQTGLLCRLPTEAEWEYACRSGGREQRYCGGDDADEFAWHDGNATVTHPVGSKQSNALGLYDMSGSLWEWTGSLYRPYPYQAEDGREEKLAAGQARVLRGGFWGLPKERARANARSSSPPDLRNFDLGFRLVCASPNAEN